MSETESLKPEEVQGEKGGEIDETGPARKHTRRPDQLTWDPEGMNKVIDSELAKPPRGRRKLGRLIRSVMATNLTRPEPPPGQALRPKPETTPLKPHTIGDYINRRQS